MADLTVISGVLPGRSLAGYCLASATGGASRRNADALPVRSIAG